jgi:DNA-binding transcriptional regulator PaaX
MEKEETIQKISDNLNILVSLYKLAYSEKIDEVRKKIFDDNIMAKILEIVPEELAANELVKKVCNEVSQKERTVRYRLSELVSMGVLTVERSGNKSFYKLSGII